MRDHHRTRLVSLHRSQGLDFLAGSDPGTLGGISVEEILANADSAKQLEINASAQKRQLLNRLTAQESEGEASLQVSAASDENSQSFFLDPAKIQAPGAPLDGSLRNGWYGTFATLSNLASSLLPSGTVPTAAELEQDAITNKNWFGVHLNRAVAGVTGIYRSVVGGFVHCGLDAPVTMLTLTIQELHEKLGHAGQAKIDSFLKTCNDLTITGPTKLGKCDICEKAKHVHFRPPSSTTKITHETPNILHFDTKFLNKASLQGATLCHDAVCNTTGMCKTFCVSSKGDFKVVLQSAIITMYSQYNRVCHGVYHDNAPELGGGITASEEVLQYLMDNNIKNTMSAPYAHEQMGYAERAHRTLDTMMRAVLEMAGMPDAFWALARCYSCEISNVMPNRRATEHWNSLGNEGECSAYGLLNGSGKVRAYWLQPFGCRCYVLPAGDQKLNALARRGVPGIFVGYATHMDSRGYVVYVPGEDKLVISSSVTFHPKEFPFKEGAVSWDPQTRQGEWVSGHKDQREILESLVQESNAYNDTSTSINRWTSDVDNPGLQDTPMRGWDNSKPASPTKSAAAKRKKPNDLSYRSLVSTKGLTQVIEPSAEEIRKMASDGARCTFQQNNPKSGQSYDRYEQYKSCTSVAEFIERGFKVADFKNDYGRGYVKCTFQPQDDEPEQSSDSESNSESDSDSEPEPEPEPEPDLSPRKRKQPSRKAKVSGLVEFCQFVNAFTWLHAATTVTSTNTTIHGMVVDSHSQFHNMVARSALASVMKDCNVESDYISGLVDPPDPFLCYVDLLRPYSEVGNATLEFARDTWNWDTASSISAMSMQKERTFDDIFVLYADGSEQSLTNMQDILTGVKTPWTIREACEESPQKAEWIKALKIEMQQLIDMGVYTLVDRSSVPKGQTIVTSKIAWRLKLDGDNNPIKYKARAVARGFTQRYGVNFKETFQPVARVESVRTFIAAAVASGWVIQQLDFDGAYLQGEADCPIYMSFPPELNKYGCGIPDGKVCLLRKSLYGLRQAGWIWWQTLTSVLEKHGFVPCDAEPCCFIRKHGNTEIRIILHVDDGLVVSNNQAECDAVFASIRKTLAHSFNTGPADWYLGMKIQQTIEHGILVAVTLSQKAYIEQICKRNGIALDKHSGGVRTPCTQTKMTIEDCPKVNSNARGKHASEHDKKVIAEQAKFRANVGALLFLCRCTMPMISFAVGRLGRFSSNSGESHWKEMKHLVRFIKSFRHMGIRYSRPNPGEPGYISSLVPKAILASYNSQKVPHFRCYTDSDFAGCPDSSRSTSGNVVVWMGAAISWASQLQACVTLSTAEAEMVALSKAAQEVIWLRRFVSELLGGEFTVPSTIDVDNNATLDLVDNRTHHSRTKHINLRRNFVRERKASGELDPRWIDTKSNLADGFTKAVTQATNDSHCFGITGMHPIYD